MKFFEDNLQIQTKFYDDSQRIPGGKIISKQRLKS